MKISFLLCIVVTLLVVGVVGARVVRPPLSTTKPSITLPSVNFKSESECNKMCAEMKKPNARKLCGQVCSAEFRKESRFATLTPPLINRAPYP
ncbi:hypothetical protein PRIPAC_81518 [Pristionchus pacificus]|uniref:Uncharacterized protein n=1 Tax=Pristionchus pacificus TaxID=54126 RepID=A0A454XLL4_PRIPA|nr:hypothetical protein PRIPAC_81518 [Pristionchus pacificus]|eukprot:PDM72627.1 hypothetical protein PRIPAC_39061 [Pristionchus pacificus]